METLLTTIEVIDFQDGIHHTSWLLRGIGPCSMRYKSGIMVSVISIFEAFEYVVS
jgi:hypothetical protein